MKVVVTYTVDGLIKITPLEEYRSQSRAGKGTLGIKLTNTHAIGILLADRDAEVIALTRKGLVIRFNLGDLRLTGRGTRGVRVIN